MMILVTCSSGFIGSALILRLLKRGDMVIGIPACAVIHFAAYAYAYVVESVTEPLKYYRNNVARTLTLLEAKMGARRPGDPPSLVADANQARQQLGWQPQFTQIEQIIQTAWAWSSWHGAASLPAKRGNP